jgi:hypothetical protein
MTAPVAPDLADLRPAHANDAEEGGGPAGPPGGAADDAPADGAPAAGRPERARREAEHAAIGAALAARVRAAPEGAVNAPELRAGMAEQDRPSSQVVSSYLARLARPAEGTAYLAAAGQVKVANPASKDRPVTQYRATDAFKRHLGLLPQAVAVTDAAGLLRAVQAYLEARGFACTLDELANFYLCLQAQPFVLLSGISGTGKSRLPRLFAEATGSARETVPVKPNWSDNSDLMGYYSSTLDRFVPGRMLEAVRAALETADRPYFVVLDEMNLAHVEHYLSDVLSVMESRTPGAGGTATTDPLPVDVPAVPGTPGGARRGAGGDGDENAEPEADPFAEFRDLPLPWNLFLVGTVNVDETTHPFSRKVLDRAFAIDYDAVDLTRFAGTARGAAPVPVEGARPLLLERPVEVRQVYADAPAFFNGLAEELAGLNAALRPAGSHFAYRVRDQVLLYMWAWRARGLEAILTRDRAFDFCLLQKVLPRCQGSTDVARRALEAVYRHAALPRPAAVPPAVGAGEELEAAPGADAAPAQRPVGDVPTPAAARRAPRPEVPLDPYAVDEVAGAAVWRYPRTAAKALAMLRRYADTGYFAFWS